MKNKHGIDICKLCSECLSVMKNSNLKCDMCDNFDGTIPDLKKHRKVEFLFITIVLYDYIYYDYLILFNVNILNIWIQI